MSKDFFSIEIDRHLLLQSQDVQYAQFWETGGELSPGLGKGLDIGIGRGDDDDRGGGLFDKDEAVGGGGESPRNGGGAMHRRFRRFLGELLDSRAFDQDLPNQNISKTI
jgi:hypothetical protein